MSGSSISFQEANSLMDLLAGIEIGWHCLERSYSIAFSVLGKKVSEKTPFEVRAGLVKRTETRQG